LPYYLGDREDGAAVWATADRVADRLQANAGEQIHTGQVLAVAEARTGARGGPGTTGR